ncbi:hypothetical protein HAX54_036882 [Datura stramonium]|uniref:TF-B3 domain-containing protein n=1 Tax=Datura stramonium TaxID=4076 RepID=A0ABS8VI89_DATST|nr:hypothetical protein [Datura stramonium]
MEFEVSIFGSNHCQREYEGGEEINHTCKKLTSQDTTEKPKLNTESSHEAFPKVEAAENMPPGRSHFICTIKPYFLSSGRVQLPAPFVRENDLRDRKCTVTITDEQRSWKFTLASSGSHTYIRGIWNLRANASLQLKGKKPNLDAKRVSSRREEAIVPASTSANANSQFVSIIKPYATGRTVFYLPSAFARSNGLMRHCKMILRDEKQRSWSVQLRQVGPRFGITRGWRQFREANGVQIGDTYKFELIDNGTIPIAYFHYFQDQSPVTNASFQPEEKKPNLDAKRVRARRKEANVPASTFANANHQFISTITPYAIRKPCFYLPSAFANSNGLVNRRCEMILRDEKQRSWSVQLGPMGHHIAITRGWRQFREANGVQIGDTYKFELIDNGTIPIAYFHFDLGSKQSSYSGLYDVLQKIPLGFLKYLKGHKDHIEHVVLRRTGKKWLVKVNGGRFEDGWAEFVEQYDLELGDILVFRHEGDMEFEVSIFDSTTHCEREYVHEEETDKKFDLEGEVLPFDIFNLISTFMMSDFFELISHMKKQNATSCHHNSVPNAEAAAKGLHLSHSHFICTMKSYYISKSFLRVPSPFARLNRLRNRRCTITVRDHEQRSWTFSLYSCGNVTHIGGGWRNFCVANCLKEGDRMMFEIVANGKKPMLMFREEPNPNILSSREAVPNVEVVNTEMPHFSCTMKSYVLSKRFLQVPNPFARLNGLSNRKCTIMIRDREQRSWKFSLYSCGRHTCIGGGWREFCVANCLKEGDRVRFEIVSNGEKPILKLRGKDSEKVNEAIGDGQEKEH